VSCLVREYERQREPPVHGIGHREDGLILLFSEHVALWAFLLWKREASDRVAFQEHAAVAARLRRPIQHRAERLEVVFDLAIAHRLAVSIRADLSGPSECPCVIRRTIAVTRLLGHYATMGVSDHSRKRKRPARSHQTSYRRRRGCLERPKAFLPLRSLPLSLFAFPHEPHGGRGSWVQIPPSRPLSTDQP
jgi:hypothetical protein